MLDKPEDFEFLLGQTEAMVEMTLKNNKMSYRVVKKDGQAFIVTDDFIPERCNLEFEEGKLTKIYGG